MTYSGLKLMSIALAAFGLAACSHGEHQHGMGAMAHDKSGCMMNAKGGMGGDQAAMPMGQGKMGADGKAEMMAQNGCQMMGAGAKAAPKAPDEHADHHK